MEAREDFDTAVNNLADMLEDRLDGEVEFADGFEPWTFLRETMPPLADAMIEEASSNEDALEEFLKRDPNNASKMRSYFEGKSST